MTDSIVKLSDPPLFVPRIRMFGSTDWICPYSGHFNRTSVSATSFRLPCICGRRFLPGWVLYPIPRGRGFSTVPPDWVLPIETPEAKSEVRWTEGMREAFPSGDLSITPWVRHSQTHVLIDPTSADFNVSLMIKTVRRLAEEARHDDFDRLDEVRVASSLARLGASFVAVATEYGF